VGKRSAGMEPLFLFSLLFPETAEPIEMQYGMLSHVGPCMDYMGCRCPHGKGHFGRCVAD